MTRPTIWLVEDAAGLVRQPLYVALADHVWWTDDVMRAEWFGSKADADRFLINRLTTDARVVGMAGVPPRRV